MSRCADMRATICRIPTDSIESIFVDKTSARINPGSIRPEIKSGANCLACMPEMDSLLASTPALAAAWNSLPRRTLRKGQQLVQIAQTVNQVWRVESGLL